MERAVTAPGPAAVRAAGARSGIGTTFLDAALPFRGLVADVLAAPAKDTTPARRHVDHGDGGPTQVLRRDPEDTVRQRMTGGIPKRSTNMGLGAISGYGGHVEGKVAENIHGGTFRVENDRTQRTLDSRSMRRTSSAPGVHTIRSPVPAHAMTADRICEDKRRHGATRGIDGAGANVASHVPGYMVHMPGKISESVHGHSTGEVSHKAQEYRGFNPHVSCEGWIRKGVWPSDKRPTYQLVSRFVQADQQPLFSRQQEEDFTTDNKRLGSVFGLRPSRPNDFKAGDRYMHHKIRPTPEEQEKKKSRRDLSLMDPAGQPTHSHLLEAERWRLHHTLGIRNGNQRNAL